MRGIVTFGAGALVAFLLLSSGAWMYIAAFIYLIFFSSAR